jgi:small conductance mechanosensitive channel
MDIPGAIETAKPILIAFSLKVLGAIAAYIVGRLLIGFASTLVMKALERQNAEPTVTRYIGSVITVALNIILVVAILGYFGVETTSFAALVAGLGIAVGAAWGGLLSNFAAGAFILVLRPFKVGDYVVAGDVEGTVRTIGLFSTAIDTPDNVHTLVGNAKVLSGTIRRLKEALPKIAHVVATPAPDVEILTFTERGPVLAVRPYCHTAHYWEVYFGTNRTIRETFGAADYPAPEAHLRVRHQAAA